MVSRFEATILFYVFAAAAVVYLFSLIWNFLTNNPIVLVIILIISIAVFGNAVNKVLGGTSSTIRVYFDKLNTVERYGLITKTGAVVAAVFFIPAMLTDSFNIIWIIEITGVIMLLVGIELEHRASGGEKYSLSE